MQAVLIENNGNDKIAYDSLLIEKPETLSILRSKLSMNILRELSRTPACAIDVAKKLRQHEQKVYYHFRKLENAGLIYSVSSERRYGTIAKIFSVVSPVIALKLFEKGTKIKESFASEISPDVLKFFSPFIEDGKLNAKIIVGDPSPHGKYDEPARDGVHVTDFTLFLGTLVKELNYPCYKLDVEIKENDLKNNLILIGTPKTNMIIERILSKLSFKFDFEREEVISHNNNRYKDPRTGIVAKITNPFEKDKKILMLTGLRSRGVRSTSIAITKGINKLILNDNEEFVRFVEGVDRDGDMIIDDIRFLE